MNKIHEKTGLPYIAYDCDMDYEENRNGVLIYRTDVSSHGWDTDISEVGLYSPQCPYCLHAWHRESGLITIFRNWDPKGKRCGRDYGLTEICDVCGMEPLFGEEDFKFIFELFEKYSELNDDLIECIYIDTEKMSNSDGDMFLELNECLYIVDLYN